MATPQELLQAAKGGAGNVMVNRPARRPLGVRGGRMPNDPMAKPGFGSIDARPAGPRLETGGGIVGAGAAPQKPAWQVLREAGIGGQGSAQANQAAAAKLAAGAPGGSPSGGIVAEDPATTSRSFPGFKPAGSAPGYAAWSGAPPPAGPVNSLSVKPALNAIGPAGPTSGGIAPPMLDGGPAPKEMPGGLPGEDVKAMTMPGTVQRPPAAGMGSTVSDPSTDAFTSLGRVGAGLQMRPRRPMGDFGPPPQQGPESY